MYNSNINPTNASEYDPTCPFDCCQVFKGNYPPISEVTNLLKSTHASINLINYVSSTFDIYSNSNNGNNNAFQSQDLVNSTIMTGGNVISQIPPNNGYNENNNHVITPQTEIFNNSHLNGMSAIVQALQRKPQQQQQHDNEVIQLQQREVIQQQQRQYELIQQHEQQQRQLIQQQYELEQLQQQLDPILRQHHGPLQQQLPEPIQQQQHPELIQQQQHPELIQQQQHPELIQQQQHPELIQQQQHRQYKRKQIQSSKNTQKIKPKPKIPPISTVLETSNVESHLPQLFPNNPNANSNNVPEINIVASEPDPISPVPVVPTASVPMPKLPIPRLTNVRFRPPPTNTRGTKTTAKTWQPPVLIINLVQCKLCPRFCMDEVDLEKHMTEAHPLESQFLSCDICNTLCLGETKLKLHKLTH